MYASLHSARMAWIFCSSSRLRDEAPGSPSNETCAMPSSRVLLEESFASMTTRTPEPEQCSSNIKSSIAEKCSSNIKRSIAKRAEMRIALVCGYLRSFAVFCARNCALFFPLELRIFQQTLPRQEKCSWCTVDRGIVGILYVQSASIDIRYREGVLAQFVELYHKRLVIRAA